jgi:hypothetical protein
VRPAPLGTEPLSPLRNSDLYTVPLEAGQSVVALAVAAADDCIAVEEEDWVVEYAGGVVDCAVGLRCIISFQARLYHYAALLQV